MTSNTYPISQNWTGYNSGSITTTDVTWTADTSGNMLIQSSGILEPSLTFTPKQKPERENKPKSILDWLDDQVEEYCEPLYA